VTSWGSGTWLNPPPSVVRDGDALLVMAAAGSDFWQQTSYGFRRDSGHALLSPFSPDSAVEVSFVVDYGELYDQAGVLVRVDERTWIKAGVEISDGAPQLAAVVTRGSSDWSMAPVRQWAGAEVTVRASWSGDALTLRARASGGPWRMLRLAPLPPGTPPSAGPYCCAPQREGLIVRFTGWHTRDADRALHIEE
jgi:regulation of enolase protein 1 (concanavalin A-like superfamily)